MKRTVSIISSTMIGLAVTIIAAGLTSCSKTDNPDTPDPSSGPNIGTYLWGEELYPMGANGAKTLAEMYSKTNIKTLYLLVKGTNGRVGFLANPAGEYEPARTDRDLLQEVTTAMHDKNIKVYAWIYASEDSCYAKKFPAEACHHFRSGPHNKHIDLNSTAFSDYLARMINVIRENYKVDGIMFDHLRYNGLYFGWSEKDFKSMTTDPEIGMTLDEYNEAVRLMAATYNYPIAKNSDGRYVYNAENPEKHENIPNAIFDAAEKRNATVLKLMKYRELTVDRISTALLSACKGIPTMYASMPEVVTDPAAATLSYGTTINDTYLFTYVSPMLYSADYGEDAEWVKKGCNFLLSHKYDCVPSLQAYRPGTTESLTVDVAAAKSTGCKNYNLFRSLTYDIACVAVPKSNNINLTYFKGTNSPVGTVKIKFSDASKIQNITLGGAFSGVQYTLNGNVLTISGDNFHSIGEEGVITFELSDKISVTGVESDRIVWMDID